MVGSVVSVNPADLKVPSSNLTSALAGRVAGMIAFQRSGEPGMDNADFFIRGVTTFGYKKDPLILIDGIELTTTDLARLQVDDIASFSVLKDATATALYGSRAANGVILVTTKERSEEHTSELQSLMRSSYAVFCLKNKSSRTSSDSNEHQPPRDTKSDSPSTKKHS